MSLKHQKQSYQPLPTAAAMDNPAMIQSSGSSGSSSSEEGGSREDVANLSPLGLPTTYSSQQLMPSDTDSMEEERHRLRPHHHHHHPLGEHHHIPGIPPSAVVPSRLSSVGRSQWFTVTVLCFVNLINYMDRFTIAGVLTDVRNDFDIGNDSAGLLQTVFVISYMVCAPIFGYLGDRYSRPWIMAVGVGLWSTTTLLGSFMKQFGWFIAFRALVGIGEASYSTIAPTIISDLFVHDMRSKMLALFYFAIPVGSGLGYIVGSKTAHLANDWRWALRVTPILGIVAVFLILLIKDPVRGHSEGSHNLEATTYKQDIKALVRNRSFMLSTAGFTCVAFVAGALAWWGPSFIYLGMKMQPGNENIVQDDISYKFGLVAMLAGLIGVPLGSFLAQRLRGRYENCDPYICAVGLFISAPMVFAALVVPQTSESLCFFFVFVAQVALNLCWSIVADILLYVVVPTRRSTAEAFQILISHALGDAGSPYLVGAISEAIMKHLHKNPSDSGLTTELRSMSQVAGSAISNATQVIAEATTSLMETARSSASQEYSDVEQFEGLQYALFSTSFVEVLGGIFFIFTACFIIKDKYNATRGLQGDQGAQAVRSSVALASGQKDVESFNSDCLVLCTDIALRERT
uniref:Isoform B of Protein spinster n=1 Tax=Drosophila melanogaster TaxID=7227 RepID=Q9GQQ0-2|nr:spinster, isoform B [Drosophila melanogaster]AAG43825.1 spinster type I [Drosophila melanogaster]AAM70951.1 spinster, isoform B [Drosophila melanogaster]|eukprot:NP_725532.1 spinster, isoform B [Drosophila melanogaster]